MMEVQAQLQDHNYERAILGKMMFEPETFDRYKNRLNAGLFTAPQHQEIFKTLVSLHDSEGQYIDEVQARRMLEERNKYDDIYFSEIMMTTYPADETTYIDKLVSLRSAREFNRVSVMLNAGLVNGSKTVPQVILELSSMLERGVSTTKPAVSPISLQDVQEEETEFICDSFIPLPRKAVTLLTAPGGTGKSFVTLRIGIKYLNENPSNNAFLWLSEDQAGLTKSRAVNLGAGKDILSRLQIADDMPRHFTTLERNTMEVSPYFFEVKQILKDYDLIVLDPLIAFFGGDENNNGHARYFMQLLTEWAINENKAIIFVHHSTKGTNNARGAGAFVDAARLVYSIDKIYDQPTKKDEEPTLIHEKKHRLEFKITKDNYQASKLVGHKFEREIFPKQDAHTNAGEKSTEWQ